MPLHQDHTHFRQGESNKNIFLAVLIYLALPYKFYMPSRCLGILILYSRALFKKETNQND